jgi:hypothetical protein
VRAAFTSISSVPPHSERDTPPLASVAGGNTEERTKREGGWQEGGGAVGGEEEGGEEAVGEGEEGGASRTPLRSIKHARVEEHQGTRLTAQEHQETAEHQHAMLREELLRLTNPSGASAGGLGDVTLWGGGVETYETRVRNVKVMLGRVRLRYVSC